MIAVALHHALRALLDGLVELRVFGHGAVTVAHAMAFYVGLVDNIYTIDIAQLIPLRIIGIMARAHCVDIEALHLGDIADHLLSGHVVAAVGAEFVAVYAFEKHRFTVYKQITAGDLYRAEAHVGIKAFGNLAAGAVGREPKVIERGRLGRPERRVFYSKRQGDLAALGLGLSTKHCFAVAH